MIRLEVPVIEIRYQCEICGRQHIDPSDADTCEKSHNLHKVDPGTSKK